MASESKRVRKVIDEKRKTFSDLDEDIATATGTYARLAEWLTESLDTSLAW